MKDYYFNDIAQDYHSKRKKPWKSFIIFLEYLENKNYSFKGVNIDLGCGNGRHFYYLLKRSDVLIGIDNSFELLKISLQSINSKINFKEKSMNKIHIICADLSFLPIRTKSIKNIFSIAAIHHIKSKKAREYGIRQIFNTIQNRGFFLLTVWRRWQKNYRTYFLKDWFKRKGSRTYNKQQESKNLKDFGDKMVPWTISSEKRTYNRFYHFFSKSEIENLIKIFKVREFKIIGGPTNKDNFFILAQKIE